MKSVGVPCPFEVTRCLCQICEDQCNNGFNCAECANKGKAVHDVYMCTGFTGTYPDGITSVEVKQIADEHNRTGVPIKELLKRRKEGLK